MRDSGRIWHKYGYKDPHYYMNKFVVADRFHGGEYSRKMLDIIKQKAKADGVKSIRLDAEYAVSSFYINNGFFPHWSFKGGKTGKTFVRLAWYRWTSDELETIWRGAGRFNLRRFTYRMIKRILWFV